MNTPHDDSTNIKLIKLAQSGDKTAQNKLIEENQNLIKYIASKYAPRCKSMTYDDLVSEGTIGFISGIMHYSEDAAKENNCSAISYICIWIESAIRRAILNNDEMIRIPIHIKSQYTKTAQELAMLEQEHGQIQELEKINILNKNEISLDNYENVSIIRNQISLNTNLSEDEDFELLDTVQDAQAEKEFSHIEIEECNQKINEVLSEILTEKEKLIIKARYGLDDNVPISEADLARELNIAKARVRNIEQHALRKIRVAMKKENTLKEFYG